MRAVAAVLVLLTAALARAQDTLTPYFGPGSWIIGPDETRAMKDILGLTPDQFALVRDLARGAKAELGVLERKFQRAGMLIEQNLWVENDDGKADRKTFADLQARHAAESEKVERQFLSDAKSLLDADQAAHWEKFERARRRIILQWFEEKGATNTDLARLVRSMGLSTEEAEAVAPALEKYEHDVDVLILEYRALLKARPRWSAQRWGREDGDDAENQAEQQKMSDIADRMGRVQKSYAQMLASRLGGERSEEILRAVEPMPGWFGNLTQDGRLRELMRVSGVTDEQKAAMRTAFARAERDFRRQASEYLDMLARQQNGEQIDPEAHQRAYNAAYQTYAKARADAIKKALDALTPEQRTRFEDGTDEAKGDDDDWRREGWWW